MYIWYCHTTRYDTWFIYYSTRSLSFKLSNYIGNYFFGISYHYKFPSNLRLWVLYAKLYYFSSVFSSKVVIDIPNSHNSLFSATHYNSWQTWIFTQSYKVMYEGRVGKQVTNWSKTVVMDVIGFLCVSLGSSTVQFYDRPCSRPACPC
jgi:hypothetical protein